MSIIAKGTILYYIKKYPNAKTALLTWFEEYTKLNCKNFNELKAVYGSVSIVSNKSLVFNIKGNDYRLLVAVNFSKLASYVIWFGSHKEYDKIDVTNSVLILVF